MQASSNTPKIIEIKFTIKPNHFLKELGSLIPINANSKPIKPIKGNRKVLP